MRAGTGNVHIAAQVTFPAKVEMLHACTAHQSAHHLCITTHVHEEGSEMQSLCGRIQPTGWAMELEVGRGHTNLLTGVMPPHGCVCARVSAYVSALSLRGHH
eukprot:1047864-Pelagomonas_calceolata.AAC.2